MYLMVTHALFRFLLIIVFTISQENIHYQENIKSNALKNKILTKI